MRRIEHHDYLMKIAEIGGRYGVCADDLVAAGSLRKLGFVTAEDEREGPEIILTAAARKYIERWAVEKERR